MPRVRAARRRNTVCAKVGPLDVAAASLPFREMHVDVVLHEHNIGVAEVGLVAVAPSRVQLLEKQLLTVDRMITSANALHNL